MSEVGVARFRRELKKWLEHVRQGDEVIITDRGTPVARLARVGVASSLERLTAEGHISQPEGDRPNAREFRRVRGHGDASEYVIDEREARRG